MSAEEILAYVYLHHARFTLEDGKLRFHGPKSVLTPQLRRAIKDHKEALINLIQSLEENGQSLPDAVVIPAALPNTLEELANCIDNQRDLKTWAENHPIIKRLQSKGLIGEVVSARRYHQPKSKCVA
jgi:hypothetical protein